VILNEELRRLELAVEHDFLLLGSLGSAHTDSR
jgi:hypothetical protein